MLRTARLAVAAIIVWSAAGPAGAQCVGDCDRDDTVAVRELISGVNIAVGRAAVANCPTLDMDTSRAVSVAELTVAVGNALDGCPTTACGDPDVQARYATCRASETEADCLNAGGTWAPFQYSGIRGCFCRTGQDGCPCTDASDCLSECVGQWPAQRLGACEGVVIGQCAAESPVAGCFCVPWQQEGEPDWIGLCIDP